LHINSGSLRLHFLSSTAAFSFMGLSLKLIFAPVALVNLIMTLVVKILVGGQEHCLIADLDQESYPIADINC